MRQEPPFAVQLEATEGCNLFCGFCGLQGIREKSGDFKFMNIETADHVGRLTHEAGWNPRVEFAMHGEPTMNRKLPLLVAAVRGRLPRASIMVTSNGGGLLRGSVAERVIELFDSGVNTLALDDYDYAKIVPRVVEALRGVRRIWRYPQDPTANPHNRFHGQRVVVIEDISRATKGTHSLLNNHAGSAFPKNDSANGKPCAKPFRELSVRWDGSVAICCNDWRGEYVIGNANDVESIEALWQSSEFEAARRRLYLGQRDFGPCRGCDALSYRTGLLPDKKGEQRMEAPRPEDDAVISRALSRGPLARSVARPWELTVEGRPT